MVHYPQEVLEEQPLLLICLQRFDLQYVYLFIFPQHAGPCFAVPETSTPRYRSW